MIYFPKIYIYIYIYFCVCFLCLWSSIFFFFFFFLRIWWKSGFSRKRNPLWLLEEGTRYVTMEVPSELHRESQAHKMNIPKIQTHFCVWGGDAEIFPNSKKESCLVSPNRIILYCGFKNFFLSLVYNHALFFHVKMQNLI